MKNTEKPTLFDMVILGGGPAGFTTALYAARAGLSALVLEQLSPGGQMALSHQIDNYPGFEDGIDGFTLAQKMEAQALRFGAVTELAEVQSVDLHSSPKRIQTSDGTFYGKTVVIATGAVPRTLGLPEEQALTGRGLHYCAACDGMFYRGKTVVVVGGGNSAAADALLLSRVAKKVIVVHRRDTLRAEKSITSRCGMRNMWNFAGTVRLFGFPMGTGSPAFVSGTSSAARKKKFPATAFLSASDGVRQRRCLKASSSWTSRGISLPTRPPPPSFRAFTPSAMCGPNRYVR